MSLEYSRKIVAALFSVLLIGCQRNHESVSYTTPVPEGLVTENMEIQVDDKYILAGTLTIPADDFEGDGLPAVIIITGSSAHDRDNFRPSAPLSAYRPFRQIAETLTRDGIAVLRLDDRGTGSSTGRSIRRVSLAGRRHDISEAMTFLASRSEIDPDKIGLLGLSEGAPIAQMLAVEDDRVKFLVLPSAIGYPGSGIVEYQIREKLLSARMRVGIFRPRNIQDLYEYDPKEISTGVGQPVQIIHGETDRRVPVGNAYELERPITGNGNPDVDLIVLPDHNHLLLKEDPNGSETAYGRLSSNRIDDSTLDVILSSTRAKVEEALENGM